MFQVFPFLLSPQTETKSESHTAVSDEVADKFLEQIGLVG
jgi:hypothetical protein